MAVCSNSMAAINFDQPSTGTVNTTSNALSIKNNGSGGGLECIVNSTTGSGIGVVNQAGHGIWTESKGAYAGIVAKSTTGAAINAETNSTSSAAAVIVNNGGFGIWVESRGTTNNLAIVAKSNKGNAILGESLGGGSGIVARSTTGTALIAEGPSNGNAAYFKGNVDVTGDIRLVNADCAEDFDVSNDTEPGTVMVLNDRGTLEPSCFPYDKKVAGIISGAGGFKPGIVLDKHEQNSGRTRMSIALMGKVFCKVDATLSSIEVGDLLTTSSTIGHAMKACDPLNAFGAVIGKALQSFKSGKGTIPVLVSLQ